MARAEKLRRGEPLDPVAVLRDTLARIDRMLEQLESRAQEGDSAAGALYIRLMKQRGDTALKIKQLQPGKDRLLQWLMELMTKGKP